jgi:hypothetical protein
MDLSMCLIEYYSDPPTFERDTPSDGMRVTFAVTGEQAADTRIP